MRSVDFGEFLFVFFINVVAAHANCKDRIDKIICEVAATERFEDRFTLNRPCLNKPIRKYQEIFKNAFSKLPTFLQDRFCSLERIYIEDKFFAPAWSVPVDEKNPTRFLLGFRKDELDANLSFSNGRAQFDSQTFGHSVPIVFYSTTPENLLTSTDVTLIHELGHTFDYEYHYNRAATDPNFLESWSAISWSDIQVIRSKMDFPLRKSICLNNCSGNYLSSDLASELYSEIFTHGFISQLSTTNAMEDFAETFAFFVMNQFYHLQVGISVGAAAFDLQSIEISYAFARKWSFLKSEFKIPQN